MKPAIKIEDLSKQYRLGTVGTGTFSHDVNRWWQTSVLGKEDPYLKIGETNDRSSKANSEYVWALKDINFEVQPGEVLGIIGKNGAGKSTLLKLLSRVTAPTTGKITAYGRIASLLEVGTGFHPELTGRENIYLNGAILGMTKAEVKSKFDEIVDFAGCERYIDTPVKRYSSGMYVRLAFAVAAHLEPEILVVDEVLAVGDAEFQKKAIGKMKDVSQGEGRTVLFVSHNMGSVRRLCNRGIILENGRITYTGGAIDAVESYLNDNKKTNSILNLNDNSLPVSLEKICLSNDKGKITSNFHFEDNINIEIYYKIHELTKGINLSFGLKNSDSNFLFRSWDVDENPERLGKREPGDYIAKITIPSYTLNKGSYFIYLATAFTNKKPIKIFEDIMVIRIDSGKFDLSWKSFKWGGDLIMPLNWQIQKQN